MRHCERLSAWCMAGLLLGGLCVFSAHVIAGGNAADEIEVEIDPLLIDSTFFTPGAQVPDALPVGMQIAVQGEFGSVVIEDIASVEAAMGGTLEVDGEDMEVIDPIETQIPELYFSTPMSGSRYAAVFDGALLDFVDESSGGTTRFVAESVIHAIATADIYYNGGTVMDTASDSSTFEIALLDAATVDADGNLIPNASRLPAESTQIIDLDGNFTFVVDLDESDRGFSTEEESFWVLTETGPVAITVRAPDLAEIIAADPATYGDITTGRIVVTVATDAAVLVDTPDGADPLAQFDLEDGGSPAPAPRSLFVRTVCAVTSDARGGAEPTWTIVDSLPDPLEISVDVFGPGVRELLLDVGDIFGYEYALPVAQSGENLVADQNDAGWNFATVEVLESLPGSLLGEDTIELRSSRGTAIFGSNAMPELRSSGGGGGGGCFIATAAYGTPMATEIQSLRDVRDAYLIDTMIGAAFVDAYYRISPPIARMASENATAKTVVRAVLAPVVALSGLTMAAPGVATSAVTALAMIAVLLAIRAGRRAAR